MKRERMLLHGPASGSAALEAAIVLPLLLLLILGAMEFARALWIYNTMLLGVEDGARYVMVHYQAPGALPSCGAQTPAARCPAPSATALATCAADRVENVLGSYQLSDVGVSVSQDAASPPAVTLCASYTFEFLASAFLPYGPLNLDITLTVPSM